MTLFTDNNVQMYAKIREVKYLSQEETVFKVDEQANNRDNIDIFFKNCSMNKCFWAVKSLDQSQRGNFTSV